MNTFIKLILKHLIQLKEKTITETAIKNCHVHGLHSFIINKRPKIRLFIAEDVCPLRYEFDYTKPYLTIHPHKHNDIFIPLTENKIIHHLYKETNHISENTIKLVKHFYGRLSDKNTSHDNPTHSISNLEYIGPSSKLFLKSKELHSVSIHGKGKCAWLIIEIGTDKNFKQLSYGGEPLSTNCYQPFPDAIKYLKKYLEI